MLLDSFARLAKVETRFRGTYEVLEQFARRHADWKWIDPATVSRELPLVDSFALAAALTEGVRRGVLRAKFTVLTPDGVIAPDAFDTPSEIPSELPDRFDTYFSTRFHPLVTVFEEATENAAQNIRNLEIAASVDETWTDVIGQLDDEEEEDETETGGMA